MVYLSSSSILIRIESPDPAGALACIHEALILGVRAHFNTLNNAVDQDASTMGNYLLWLLTESLPDHRELRKLEDTDAEIAKGIAKQAERLEAEIRSRGWDGIEGRLETLGPDTPVD